MLIVDYVDTFAGDRRLTVAELEATREALRKHASGVPRYEPGSLRKELYGTVTLTADPESSGSELRQLAHEVVKSRPSGFPTSWPGKASYDVSFGTDGRDPAWLRRNRPEHSRTTFQTHASDEGWLGTSVQGPLEPGALVVRQPFEPSLLGPRTGLVVSVRPSTGEVDVVWNPWTFKVA